MKKFDDILRKSEEIKDYTIFDVNLEWNQFSAMLENNLDHQSNPISTSEVFSIEDKRHIIYLLSFAAVMILVFASLFLFSKSESNESELISKSDSESIELIDGTKINVSPNSTLKYYTNLEYKEQRFVSLQGSGQFDVSRSILPFIVYHNEIFVEVLGTSFKILQESDKIKIVNISGTVKVGEIKNKDNFRILKEGDVFHYSDGLFINPADSISNKSINAYTPAPLNKEIENSKPVPEKNKEENTAIALKGRKYTLESVINNYLIKFNKKKIKIDKKAKPDLNKIITIDDINKPYKSILEDLKQQGVIDFISGDCPDCFIIRSPEKKN
ncbi:MAG: FecR domain-containing protein [Saprospiraceae bacterium]|nr:FecR domain-containing protein [Saprospiraceae bacterium]